MHTEVKELCFFSPINIKELSSTAEITLKFLHFLLSAYIKSNNFKDLQLRSHALALSAYELVAQYIPVWVSNQ